jgi:hypothetical protein
MVVVRQAHPVTALRLAPRSMRGQVYAPTRPGRMVARVHVLVRGRQQIAGVLRSVTWPPRLPAMLLELATVRV